MKQYLYALSMIAGTTIGVGLFGLPYVAAKAGFITVLGYFIFIFLLILSIQLIYGEITLRTYGNFRAPGYTGKYLGQPAKMISLASGLIGLYGANLAYIVVGGGFLAGLLSPIFGGGTTTYTLIFFAIGTLYIFLGTKSIARSEFLSLCLFFGVLIFLFYKSLPHIEINNLVNFDLKYFFLPYGVVLFSMTGMSVIPEAREILAQNAKRLRSVIFLGTLIPAITYITFIFLILGVSGQGTTVDGLSGMRPALGERALAFGYLFGIISTFTSYLTLGLTLKKIYWYDMKLPHWPSWLLASFVPLFLYAMGVNNFIAIIGFTGAVTAGIDGILMFLTYLKAKKNGQRKPEYHINLPKLAIYLMIALFLGGVILGILPI